MLYVIAFLLIIMLIFFVKAKNNFKKTIYLLFINLMIVCLSYHMNFSFFALIFLILTIVNFISTWLFAMANYPVRYPVIKNVDIRYTPYLLTLLCLINISIFMFLIDINAGQFEASAKSTSNVTLVMKNFFLDYQPIVSAIPVLLFLGIVISLEMKESR